jgi:phytoene/squalene synthetase
MIPFGDSRAYAKNLLGVLLQSVALLKDVGEPGDWRRIPLL